MPQFNEVLTPSRIKEPSTWAGLAAVVHGIGSMIGWDGTAAAAQAVGSVAQGLSVEPSWYGFSISLAGAVAMFMREGVGK
ncbi:MAG: hypothetical protein ACPGO3_13330 [Magnetospiraceae bacterium]